MRGTELLCRPIRSALPTSLKLSEQDFNGLRTEPSDMDQSALNGPEARLLRQGPEELGLVEGPCSLQKFVGGLKKSPSTVLRRRSPRG